jgi:hypothetical protein
MCQPGFTHCPSRYTNSSITVPELNYFFESPFFVILSITFNTGTFNP